MKLEDEKYRTIPNNYAAAPRHIIYARDADKVAVNQVLDAVIKRHHSVAAYCEEEVRRQGHDIAQLDGIQRVAWMLEAWAWMLAWFGEYVYEAKPRAELPTVNDIMTLGMKVEPGVNDGGFRTCGVRVGPNVVPGSPDCIPSKVERLLAMSSELEPLEFYRAFENIHPFQDGNGRVGKILLNWRAGTLLTPFFPPADFWGGREIRNP